MYNLLYNDRITKIHAEVRDDWQKPKRQ